MNRTHNANLAPRCQHTKLNGSPCAAPARRGRKYCVFHDAAQRPDSTVRLIEDAMSLQLALFQVMRALDSGDIDPKRAALKLYALQIAASNLKRLHEEINYVPSRDPAREKSLVELLLDQFGIPHEDESEAAVDSQLETHNSELDSSHPERSEGSGSSSIDNRQSYIVNAVVDLQACADPGARFFSSSLLRPASLALSPSRPARTHSSFQENEDHDPPGHPASFSRTVWE